MMMSHNSVWMILFAVVSSLVLLATCAADDFSSAESFGNSAVKGVEDISADKRPSFFVGSRYGRSSPQVYGTKARRLNVAPRNDRFFLGSRYGKRSDENMIPAFEQDASNQSPVPHLMTCVYLGIKDFYRCNNVSSQIDNIINYLKDDHVKE